MTTNTTSIVHSDFWSDHWKASHISINCVIHPVQGWIKNHIAQPTRSDSSCFEIGCYPGKFLKIFGEKGYVLNGIDKYENTDLLVKPALNAVGHSVGCIYQTDFLTFETDQKFDVVCSFGFIEHFTNWHYLIKRHTNLVRENGTVIIEVPNFNSPIYRFLYRTFEPEVLKNHVMEALSLDSIAEVLQRENCTILRKDYIGIFYFRFVTKHGLAYTLLAGAISLVMNVVLVFFPKKYASRYMGIIANKL